MSLTLEPNALHFIPLGGVEQFGVNFNLYHTQGKWIIFDCGIGFADERFPNVDILLPDPKFIEGQRDQLVGLVITHAHEDHIGAVPYLWPRLKCPVYCTPFTAAVLRQKCDDFPNCKGMKIIEIQPDQILNLSPFTLKFLSVSHSIPEAVATVIETSHGRVVHSGDWNMDPSPVLGGRTNPAQFKAVGNDGVLAYIGDSTNAPVMGRGGSEKDVEDGLAKVFAECKGRIAVTIFASNIARIRSIAKAAKATQRSVCLLGRSLHRMTGAARACGYLKDIDVFIKEDDLGYVPLDRVVLIATGSQGEAPAAMARIARGEWPNIRLGKGDTVVFSSRAIPGNETEINTVKNNLSAAGVTLIDPDTTAHKIHVSGHPYRDDVSDMLDWVRPQIVVPVHGERVMLNAHASLAHEKNIPHVFVPNNGSVIRLAPDPAVIDHVQVGLLAVEPQRIVSSDHKAIAERRKLQYSGAVHITVGLDSRLQLLADPKVTMVGLVDHDNKDEMLITNDIRQEIEDTLVDLRDEGVDESEAIEEELRVAVRRLVNQVFGIKPKVSIHLLRI
jgi:ribonuclease J